MNCYTARDHGLARLWGSTGLPMDVFLIFPPLDPVVTSSTCFIFQRRGLHKFEIVKEPCKAFLLTWNYTKNAGQVAHPKAWIFLWKMDHVSPQWKETKTLLHAFSKQTWTDCSYLLTHEAVTMGMTCPHLARALLAYHRKSWHLGICLRWIRIVGYPYIPQRPYNPIL